MVSFGFAWGFDNGCGATLYVERGLVGLAIAGSDEDLWPVQVERGLDGSFGRESFEWPGR